jgi:hypothetical protein
MLVDQAELAKNAANCGDVKEARFAEHIKHLESTDVHAIH